MSMRQRNAAESSSSKGDSSSLRKISQPKPRAYAGWGPYLFTLAIVGIGALCFVITYPSSKEPVIFDLNRPGPAFSVVDIPGKGKGAIAARYIQKGELLIRERPLLLLPTQISTLPGKLILEKLGNLTPDQLAAFYNLSYVVIPHKISPEEGDKQVEISIFLTNAVAAGSNVGLFPTMARLNHGCSHAFNSVYSWREEEGVLVVHALKSIMEGEELLTAYFETRRPRDERRRHLQDEWAFHCTCASCSLPDAESKASDDRLSKMTELYRKLSTWGDGRIDGREAIKVVRRIWTIGEKEGYVSERGRLAADAAHVAAAHSDMDATMAWAELGLRWATYELGADSMLAEEMRRTATEPRSHPMWGQRARLDVGHPGHGVR